MHMTTITHEAPSLNYVIGRSTGTLYTNNIKKTNKKTHKNAF